MFGCYLAVYADAAIARDYLYPGCLMVHQKDGACVIRCPDYVTLELLRGRLASGLIATWVHNTRDEAVADVQRHSA